MLLTASGATYAQILPSAVSITSSPSSPSPGQKFTVTAGTPSTDKNTTTFTWTVDGKRRADLSGMGKNSFELTAGEVGSLTRVSVTATQAGKPIGASALNIRVSDLSLVWVAETLVPQWYKGKALPSPGSIVSVAAIPQIMVGGKTISPKNLIYQWGLDDEEKTRVGVGEDIFRIKTSDLPRSLHHVTLTVEDTGRTVKKSGEIFIEPLAPRLVIYHSTPLGGVDPRSAQSFFFIKLRGLVDFVAEPFFFPVKSRNELSFRWSVAGLDATGAPENPHVLTLDTSQRQPGEVPIETVVSWKGGFIPIITTRTLTLLLQ